MKQFVLTNLPWILGTGIPILVGIFLRFLSKQKLMNMVVPLCSKAGGIVSKFMSSKFGKKAAESIEEGVIVTISSTIYAGIDAFMKALLSDNENRQVK